MTISKVLRELLNASGVRRVKDRWKVVGFIYAQFEDTGKEFRWDAVYERVASEQV
jgi:hypothetical protein